MKLAPSKTAAASQTRLPPSPEMKGSSCMTTATTALMMQDDGFSLDAQQENTAKKEITKKTTELSPRLQSIARYQTFHPATLACSQPLVSTAATAPAASSPSIISSPISQDPSSSYSSWMINDGPFTSLGALAGSKGVAIFRISTPQTPLLLLSHTYRGTSTAITTTTTKTPLVNSHQHSKGLVQKMADGGGIASMVFQKSNLKSNTSNSSSSLYLAAARGNGVLVWDVSGHSLNPLTARMGIGSPSMGSGVRGADGGGRLVSIDWHIDKDGPQQNPWLLMGATASSAFLWDLRDSTLATSSVYSKPSLRFGGLVGSQSTGDHRLMSGRYLQLACASNSNECALLDSHGIVRIFDLRMAAASKCNTLMEARAHDHVGIGIEHMPTSSSSSPQWVTWGIDSILGNPIVRLWQQNFNATQRNESETSVSIHQIESSTLPTKETPVWSLLLECEMPDLACARVCPVLEDTLIMISQRSSTQDDTASASSWNVHLWTAASPKGKGDQLVKKLSFQAGQDASHKITGMLGSETKLGSLCAADLALSSVPRLFERDDEEDDFAMVEKREEPGLVLLSLTSTGFLTTHVIPEAIPSKLRKRRDKVTAPSSDAAFFRSAFGPQAKIYPEGKELSLGDVAWSVQDDGSRANIPRGDASTTLPGTSGHTPAADPMQFDLDVAAVFSNVDSNCPSFQSAQDKLISQVETSTGMKLSAQETMDSVDGTRNAAEFMEKIETRNVPCPRLCGATFGTGVGGLVSFHNGEVQKMWKWYMGEVSLARRNPTTPFRDDGTAVGPEMGVRDTVRTLKDLFDMMKASKESQWGEQQDSEGVSGAHDQINDNLFEDEESESLSDSVGEGIGEHDLMEDGDDEEEDDKVSDDLYDHPSEPALTKPGSSVQAMAQDEDAAPSSDMLTPHVSLSQHVDVTTLNRQSPELAIRLSLGSWASLGLGLSLERDTTSSVVSLEMLSTGSSSRHNTMDMQERRALAKYVTGRQREDNLPRIASDPLIALRQWPQTKTTISLEEDKVVHGGEYSVRPNMQESVEFLRKLFTHQQEGGDTPGIGELMSPPDKRLLPSQSPGRNRRLGPSPPIQPHLNISEHATMTPRLIPGVYTLRLQNTLSTDAKQRLFEARFLCAHNADVCKQLGEKQKAEVWDVLTEMVEARLSGSKSVWNQKLKTKLASAFLESTLKYLQKIGDVQMLSHLICVLRLKTSDLQPREKAQCTFLTPDVEQRCDSIISMYSNLLYAWGLLYHRAELNKHLSHVPHNPFEVPFDTSVQAIECSCCGETNNTGSTTCKTCNDYMFRCAVCENAVRGLFTFCIVCGHGGHINHMTEFFQHCNECPSGCGCNCVMASPQQQERMLGKLLRQASN